MTDQPRLTRACWQPWESLNIAADAKVYPCCVVNSDLVIGDLSERPLDEIIQGAAILSIKRRLLNGDIAHLPCCECPNAPLVTPEEFKREIHDRFLGASAVPGSSVERNADDRE
jgi:radical SAM protein with 4Fe4S-binding SPASM domain